MSMPSPTREMWWKYKKGEISKEEYQSFMDDFWDKTLAEMEDRKMAQKIQEARYGKPKETKKKTKIIIISVIILLIVSFFCISAINNTKSNEPKAYSYTESKNISVYITKTGECYHKSGCTSLRKSKKEITLEKATKNYRLCQNCKPPIIEE